MRVRIILFVLVLLVLTGCSGENKKVDVSEDDSYPVESDFKEEKTINIIVNNITYTAHLKDNETALAFESLLPLNLEMKELNGNEKFSELNRALPETITENKQIKAGDLMLYGDQTLVLFYKDFTTTYSYSPIAKIDDPKGLEEALGRGDSKIEIN